MRNYSKTVSIGEYSPFADHQPMPAIKQNISNLIDDFYAFNNTFANVQYYKHFLLSKMQYSIFTRSHLFFLLLKFEKTNFRGKNELQFQF